jgi:hypothetical protein
VKSDVLKLAHDIPGGTLKFVGICIPIDWVLKEGYTLKIEKPDEF